VLLITVRGRRSGRTYTLPVQFARTGATIYIVPGAPAHKTWWRNLRGGARVQLWLRGQHVAGSAEVIPGAADPGAVKEGLQVYLRRFPGMARMYHVRRGAGGILDPDDLRAAAARTVLVRMRIDTHPT
jgi:deazaflavin-dependent oxidoreductase (nitroreductase family)